MKKPYNGVKGELKGSYRPSALEVKGTIHLHHCDVLKRRYIRPFNFLLTSLLFLLTSLSFSSCSDDKDDTPYPSLITELADCPTDAEGTMSTIVLDDDTQLTLTNPQTGLKKNATYRCLTGFTLDDGQATLYSLVGATVLHDSTAVATTDPANIVSLWRTHRYLNLHLLPKTQGQAPHTWGYIVDSIVDRHAYLCLHHRQSTDPAAYSADLYASLPLAEVDADTLTLRIHTFAGIREWLILLASQ